jgi:hypothetical protein
MKILAQKVGNPLNSVASRNHPKIMYGCNFCIDPLLPASRNSRAVEDTVGSGDDAEYTAADKSARHGAAQPNHIWGSDDVVPPSPRRGEELLILFGCPYLGR